MNWSLISDVTDVCGYDYTSERVRGTRHPIMIDPLVTLQQCRIQILHDSVLQLTLERR